MLLQLIDEAGLLPAGPPQFFQFPAPGGVTGLWLLQESHLCCHTFPEHGYAAFNLYCCRPRSQWPWSERLAQALGATQVQVRCLRRGGMGQGGAR